MEWEKMIISKMKESRKKPRNGRKREWEIIETDPNMPLITVI